MKFKVCVCCIISGLEFPAGSIMDAVAVERSAGSGSMGFNLLWRAPCDVLRRGVGPLRSAIPISTLKYVLNSFSE